MTMLASEEAVTKLLSSNEIIKPKKRNFYISNPKVTTLGDFLLEIPLERKSLKLKTPEELKYRFIKSKK